MTEEFLNYIILLEKTLASFYDNKLKQEKYQRISSVLEFMSTHSFAHADKIKGELENNKKPEFSKDILLNFQNTLTNDIFTEIDSERDLAKVLKIFADSEEALGALYNKIVEYMEKLSKHYKESADLIRSIALEEMDHRDLLLKDKERVEKRSK